MADNPTLVPAQVVGEVADRFKLNGDGCVIKKTSLMVQPVRASVTVTLQSPAPKVVGFATVKVLRPFVHK